MLMGIGVEKIILFRESYYQLQIQELQEELKYIRQKREIAKYKPHLRVIKNLESHYRRKDKMLPTCPRCNELFYIEELTHWVCKALADKRIKMFKEKNQE